MGSFDCSLFLRKVFLLVALFCVSFFFLRGNLHVKQFALNELTTPYRDRI